MNIVTVPRETVPSSPTGCASWQAAVKDAVRDPVELCRLLELPSRYEADALRSAGSFPLFAPRSYVARMRRGNIHDPLLRQVLPTVDEQSEPAGFSVDPVGDRRATRSPGLLHKYRGRVLMVTTGACAVHCRYCFRRHFPYAEAPRSLDGWEPALSHIRDDASVHEVILSGGDPLMVVDSVLAKLTERIAAIPHVRRLRIHTRLPIMIPERVTRELLGWMRGSRLMSLVVVHANHPAELSDEVGRSLARLVDAGIPVLNQSVLLKGVNDDVEVLAELSQQLVDLRVMPYYLHQLDRVLGAAHFEVPVSKGRRLVSELRRRLPGYAVPRYVREVPSAQAKVPIN